MSEQSEWTGETDEARRRATDEADRYRGGHGHRYVPMAATGDTSISVLEFLNGLPWDNLSLNFVHALRPSSIRVVTPNHGATSDAQGQRVTVTLGPDGRTILGITQEVEVGLIGCQHGYDLRCAQETRAAKTASRALPAPSHVAALLSDLRDLAAGLEVEVVSHTDAASAISDLVRRLDEGLT